MLEVCVCVCGWAALSEVEKRKEAREGGGGGRDLFDRSDIYFLIRCSRSLKREGEDLGGGG